MDEDINIELDNDNAEVELENTDTIYKALYDYNDLDAKPSINNVTLVGNKTSHQLGLADETDMTKVINNIGGEDYDNTATYEVGDIVKHQGQLYICTVAITSPENWNATHWSTTDVLSSAGGNEIAIGDNTSITGKTKIFIEEETKRLKYKDSITGQFENIAGDEIAIGTDEDITEDTKLLIEPDEEPDIVSEVVNSLSGNEINKSPSVKTVIDTCIGRLLWTNSSPTSDFENQTIEINGTGCDTYDIYYKVHKSYDYVKKETILVGKKGLLTVPTTEGFTADNTSRMITSISTSGITFGHGYNGSTVSEGRLVPLYIVGYYTGLFS